VETQEYRGGRRRKRTKPVACYVSFELVRSSLRHLGREEEKGEVGDKTHYHAP